MEAPDVVPFELLGRLSQIAKTERLEYISSLSTEAIESAGLLDLPHQAIIRETHCDTLDDQIALIDRYCSSESARRGLQSAAAEGRKPDSVATTRVAAGAGYRGGDGVLQRTFARLSAQLPQDKYLCLCNSFGFAAYPKLPSFRFNDIEISPIADSLLSSTGARMFYGFSIGERGKSYLLREPLQRMGLVLWWYLRNRRLAACGSKSRQQRMIEELRKVSPELLDRPADLLRVVEDAIMLHEVGHHRFFEIDSAVAHALSDFHVEQWPSPDFPTSHQVQAWGRITAGTATLSDIVFLLNDLLANLSIITLAECSEDVIAVLRAFHWWLACEPSERRRIRGAHWFLALTDENCGPGEAESVLRAVFSAATDEPTSLLPTLRSIDIRLWKRLLKKYGNGVSLL